MVENQFIIKETQDYPPLLDLFIKNDLEYDKDEEWPEILKMWRVDCLCPDSSEILVGGTVLGLRDGELCIEGIALEPEYRNKNLASLLMEKAIEEARRLDGKRIALIARAPGFFKSLGFYTVPQKDSPIQPYCFQCSQYGTKCFPEVMALDL